MTRDADTIIATHSRLGTTPLVPEVRLHLAADATGIFGAIAQDAPDNGYPPYWAFAWPGGQATARYLLDTPSLVTGQRVVDIGAGSGIASIAAALAGARHVLAADVDPLASAAISLNAAANGVHVAATTDDLLGGPPEADLILLGDLVYEPELATRVAAFLQDAARRGIAVLLADRTTAKRPPVAFDLVAEYDAPLIPALPAHPFERARLWRLTPAPIRRRKPGQTR